MSCSREPSTPKPAGQGTAETLDTIRDGFTLIVLAAGVGSRYGGLKQMEAVGPAGETILEYSVFDAIRAGFAKLIFVIRKDFAGAFQGKIARKLEGLTEVNYVFQELDSLPKGFQLPSERRKPWGTAHAILSAREAVSGPFMVINADDFYGPSAYRVQHEFLQTAMQESIPIYSMVGYVLRNTLSEHGSVSRAVCRCDRRGYLQDVVERERIEHHGQGARYIDIQGESHSLSGNELVSMNCWGFTPSVFESLKNGFEDFLKEHGKNKKSEFYITRIVSRLLAEGRAKLKVLESQDAWFGITYPEDKPGLLENVRMLVDQGVYPDPLWGRS